tara:strand:+ start:1991 stop:3616 length:1626 start_codon:yes stop_codon:yes gene_type:complete
MAVTTFTRVAFEVLRHINAFDKVSLSGLVGRTGESRASIGNAIDFLAANGLAGTKYGDIYYPTQKGLALLSTEPPRKELDAVFKRNGWDHPLTLKKVVATLESQQKSLIQIAQEVSEKRAQKKSAELEQTRVKEASRKRAILSDAKKTPVSTPPSAPTNHVGTSQLKDSLLVNARKKAGIKIQPTPAKQLSPTVEMKGAERLHLTPIQCAIVSALTDKGALSADGLAKHLISAGYPVDRNVHSLLRPLIVRRFIGFDASKNGYALNDKGRNDILEAKGIAMDILGKLKFPYLELRTIEIIRDQGGAHGLAERRCEKAVAKAADEGGMDSGPKAVDITLSSLEKRGLIKRTGNGMVSLTVVCQSLIGLRPYSERDLRTLRENGQDEFADILVQYGEAKSVKTKKPKAKSQAGSEAKEDKEPTVDAPSEIKADEGQSGKSTLVDDVVPSSPEATGESSAIEDYLGELLTEEPEEPAKVSDAISAVAALKKKLNKPALPGIANAQEKGQLVDALVDLLSGDEDASPIVAGLEDIKKDIIANAVS